MSLETPDLPLSLWEIGRYVADGYAGGSKGIQISVGRAKLEVARKMFGASARRWAERQTDTNTFQFATYDSKLSEWLARNFGGIGLTKRLPGWLLVAPRDMQQEFWDGYVSGDGHYAEGAGDLWESTTVSRKLAVGIATLARFLGYTVSSYYVPEPSDVIQGRKVNAHPAHVVKFRGQVSPKHRQQWDTDRHRFYPVRGVDSGSEQDVYNITVDEDHTYIVEGFVTNNCTHFSRAKAGVPRSKKIRSLAWVIVRWAKQVRPRVIAMENVQEFSTWGPLDDDGQPIKERAGEIYDEWIQALERQGYRVESRMLDASHYGAPTKRKRLFVIARCDGGLIRWPKPTHGPGLKPFRTAAQCIDWSLPCPSIFERKKPLAEKTLQRVAEGIRRYVLETADPFIVRIDQQGSGRGASDSISDPLTTIVTKNRHALVAPSLVQTGYGERKGQTPRALNIQEPLGTVVAGGSKHALVAAFLAKHYGGAVGQDLRKSIGTITAIDHHSPIAAHLLKWYGTAHGQSADEPLHTITTKERFALVATFLRNHGVDYEGEAVVVDVDGQDYAIVDIGLRMLQPNELLAAQFGEFAKGYDLSAAKSKADKVRLIGNSVCPHVAKAIVEANMAKVAMPRGGAHGWL